jgi:uncharacterized lipoprotein YmbA
LTHLNRPTVLVWTLLLGACASAPTRIYTLQSIAPNTDSIAARAQAAPAVAAGSAAPAPTGPPIRVDVVHVPAALDRMELVEDVAPGEIRIRDLDQWSAPLGELARQALTADLIERLPAGRVLFPHLAKPAGALGISVDLLAFHSDGAAASAQASWIIESAAPSERQRGTAMLTTAGTASTGGSGSPGDTGQGAAATADALSVLLAQLADRIVESLHQASAH